MCGWRKEGVAWVPATMSLESWEVVWGRRVGGVGAGGFFVGGQDCLIGRNSDLTCRFNAYALKAKGVPLRKSGALLPRLVLYRPAN